MQVEIDLDNRDRKLMPGMYGNARLLLQKRENAYAIPCSALYSKKGVNYILLVSQGAVRRQPVRIRYDDGREMEVVKLLKGREVPLDGTEELVVGNKAELREGQAVTTNRLGLKVSWRKGRDDVEESRLLALHASRPSRAGMVLRAGAVAAADRGAGERIAGTS